MLTLYDDNNGLEIELWQLRQTIIRVDPAVMHDGRFGEMFTTPIKIIDIARRLIETIPHKHH
jgi:hypothetical protein